MPFKGEEITVLERIRGVFTKKPRQQSAREIAEREAQARMMAKAMEESAHVAAFANAARLVVDVDLLVSPEAETPTGEQIAGMSDEELGVLLKLADDSMQTSGQTRELKANLANLESAEGWEVADDLADIVLEVVESRERAAQQWRECHTAVTAEIQRRRRAADREARKRRFLQDHQADFMEAMVLGDDDRLAELREQLENPPEIAEEEPEAVQVWHGIESDTVVGEAEPDNQANADVIAHFRKQYAEQNGRQDEEGGY